MLIIFTSRRRDWVQFPREIILPFANSIISFYAKMTVINIHVNNRGLDLNSVGLVPYFKQFLIATFSIWNFQYSNQIL